MFVSILPEEMGHISALQYDERNTMSVDDNKAEIRRTYSQLVSYGLETYATDEVIQEAYAGRLG